MPTSTGNVRGVGAAVESGRRAALDERGTRVSCENVLALEMLATDVQGVPYHHRGYYSCRMAGALLDEEGEGGIDWCTAMAELYVCCP